ncbi:LOW QUALITY PROTEIN: transient receptor potential cation channel subfamily A member 1-like [Panicum hallii]|uniref:LOW QUALITY PROTEIN: transient receptor potential cation channel subfamily A member 1-like n=1 Tax=Panicum hallii TaxID=206008 RepID=UPI000DF4D983|nr:LOW QUALITY PROTEIN: transient receptor potential cation channel subfamily A member 1-like [Panicum hallii]
MRKSLKSSWRAELKRRLLQAAADGDLQRFKKIASVLDAGKGRLGQTVAAVKDHGAGALHIAAFPGRTALCAYLVEELHQDVNAADDVGETPLVYAVRGDTVDTVQYLLDHGANPDKPSDLGNCEIVKALLSKGADIHLFFGIGSTPLHMAAACKQYNAMKVLLDNHADCIKVANSVYTPLIAAFTAGSLECVKLLVKAGADVKGVGTITPLLFAVKKGLTDFYECLLEAGADPNFHDDFGNLPIEIAANKNRRIKDVAILFPVTSRVPYVHDDWSIDGIISYVKSMLSMEDDPLYKMGPAYLKSEGSKAYKRKDYVSAVNFYSMAIKLDPSDVILHSNKSLCWINLGDGEKALLDAEFCRMMHPDWPKACYRQGAAHMLLKNYEKACDAFLDGLKLDDPTNVEIEKALREACNSLKISRGTKRVS